MLPMGEAVQTSPFNQSGRIKMSGGHASQEEHNRSRTLHTRRLKIGLAFQIRRCELNGQL